MESEPDAIECEHGNSATRPITTADATTTTITTTTNVDRPPSPHAPWKDIGNDSYSSEHESEALSASCTEPADNWLAAPAGAGETKGSKDGLPSAALYYPSRPRTITLLLFFVLVLVGSAFQRGAHHRGLESDIWEGLSVASFVLLTVGVLVFPTGPFTYPHPVVWRLLFGVSLLYLLALDFVLFQRYRYVRAIIASASTDPLIEEISNSTAAAAAFLSDEEDECALSFRSVWTKVDSSALHQTVCWMVKAIVVRDSSVLWVLNFLQALTETHVRTLLPPTANESGCSNSSSSSCCWWQSLALDPFVFNAVGIHAGMYVCKKLEMMELQWDEIISLKNTAARLKRAVLQFTPEAWSRIRWLDLDATHYKRFVGAVALLLGVQLMDLNGVFLQHVFRLPARHSLVVARIVLLSLIGAPSVQQLYLYITGRSYGRLGSQCWVYFAIVLSELVVLAKFGKEVMSEELRKSVAILMAMVVLSSGAAIALLAVCQHKGFVRVPSYRRKKLRKKRRSTKNT